MRAWIACATLTLAFTSQSARADQVVLKGGEVLEGVVVEHTDDVEIRMDVGSITLSREEVAEIKRTPNALAELAERRSKLAATDAEGLYKLGLWAEKAGLDTTARSIFEEVVALKGDHDGARRALGYRKVDGKWLDEDTFMAVRGFIKKDGRWLSKEAFEAELAVERAAEERRERELDARRLAILEARVEEANARARKAEAEAERARTAAEKSERRAESTVVTPYYYPGYVYGSATRVQPVPQTVIRFRAGAAAGSASAAPKSTGARR